MAETVYRIRIQTTGTGQAAANIEQVTEAGGRLGEVLKGMAQGAGQALALSAFAGLRQIPVMMGAAIERGIEFNKTLEQTRLALASIVRANTDAPSFDAAFGEAGVLLDILKVKAKQSDATLQELAQGFQATAGAAIAAGIPLRDYLNLLPDLANAVQLFAGEGQLVQELKSILTGNIGPDSQAAGPLGITSESIKKAQQAGTMVKFLTEQLKPFSEAVSSPSLARNVSNFTDQIDQLTGAASKPIFDALRNSIGSLNSLMGQNRLTEFANGLAKVSEEALKAGAAGVKSVGGLSGLANLAQGAGKLAAGTLGQVPAALYDAATSAVGVGIEAIIRRGKVQAGGGGAPPPAPNAKPPAPFPAVAGAADLDAALATRDKFLGDIGAARRSGLSGSEALAVDGQTARALRDKLAGQLGIDGGTNADEMGRAIQDQGRADLVKPYEEMVKLEKGLSDAQTDLDEKRAKAKATQEEIVTSAREEYSILRARLSGNDELATKLEIERGVRQEIAAMREQGIEDPDAEAQVRKNGELALELSLRQQINTEKNASSAAEEALAKAEAGTNRRAIRDAKQNLTAAQRFENLRGEGVPEAEARRRSNEYAANVARKEFRDSGIIGGPVSTADPSQNIGAIRSGFDILKPMRGNTVGNLLPQPSQPGAGGNGAQSGKDASGLPKAADKIDGAATAQNAAAAKIEAAAGKITTSANSLATSLGSMTAAVTGLEARVKALEAGRGQ